MVTKKKTTRKKTAGKSTAGRKRIRKSKKPEFNRNYVIGSVVLVSLAIILLGYLIITALQSDPAVLEEEFEDEAVIIVNGEEVMASEIAQVQNDWQMQTGQVISTAQVAEEVVFQKVLVQEARARGIEISDEEVEEALEPLLQQQGMTLAGLREQIEAEGLDYSEFLEQQKEGMMIERLALEESGVEEPTDEEVRVFFDENPELFEEGVLFEDVEGMISDHLQQEQNMEAIVMLGQELMMQADIEFLNEDYNFARDDSLEIEI